MLRKKERKKVIVKKERKKERKKVIVKKERKKESDCKGRKKERKNESDQKERKRKKFFYTWVLWVIYDLYQLARFLHTNISKQDPQSHPNIWCSFASSLNNLFHHFSGRPLGLHCESLTAWMFEMVDIVLWPNHSNIFF